MKPETILNGLIKAHMVINNREVALNPDPKMIRLFDKSARQYLAFRNRILKMFAEKDIEITSLVEYVSDDDVIFQKYEQLIEEKDQRIAELLDKNMNKESEANKWREGYAKATRMLQYADVKIAELEDAIQFLKDNWGLHGIIEEEYE